jgi:branched-chain amino acid transport system substrate-binding protein
MKHKLLVLLSIVMVLAMVLTGCKPASTAYKIAIVVPLSGDVKTFGESTLNGAMMAIDAAKAKGMNIEVVTADSKCDAQEATNAANKVITQDKVHYIIGEVCSSASIPIAAIAEANKVLQISPTSTNPAVTVNEDGSVKKYVFRACFLDPFQGDVLAALAKELGAKKMAILYDVGNDYVKGLAEYTKASFEKMGGTVPVYEAYTKDDTDFSAVLGKVADANVDVMVLPDYYPKVNLIAQQVKEKGIKAILMGGDGWDSPDLKLSLLEGAYFSNHYSPFDPRPVVQDFVAAYKAKFGVVPDALATLAYDAANILIQSIKDAGVDDPTVVAQKMEAIKFSGVSGDITFDAKHNPIKKAAVMKISGGAVTFFKFVAP